MPGVRPGAAQPIGGPGGTSKLTLSVLFEPALEPLTKVIAKTNEWMAALENENVGKKDGNLMVLPPWAWLVYLAMA